MNMTEKEWRQFAALKSLDPFTGAKIQSDEDEEAAAAQFDEWAAGMRAWEFRYKYINQSPQPKRWRLRWIQE